MITTLLLVCGAMTISWICDTITESGFGSVLDTLVCIFIVFLITLVISWMYFEKTIIERFEFFLITRLCQVW